VTVVYYVGHLDGGWYVPTLAVARQALANMEPDEDGHIVKVTISDRLGRRDLYCALLNREAFAAEQEELVA
jgi:hypothetical protein